GFLTVHLEIRSERPTDHVAEDRRLAEDRRGVEPAHSGGGMMIRGVALVAVLAVRLLATPLSAEAQPVGKVAVVGYLSAGPPLSVDETFRQAMRELGYVEGRNTTIESRFARGDAARLQEAAAALVHLNVDVIVTRGPAATRAAKEA